MSFSLLLILFWNLHVFTPLSSLLLYFSSTVSLCCYQVCVFTVCFASCLPFPESRYDVLRCWQFKITPLQHACCWFCILVHLPPLMTTIVSDKPWTGENQQPLWMNLMRWYIFWVAIHRSQPQLGTLRGSKLQQHWLFGRFTLSHGFWELATIPVLSH